MEAGEAKERLPEEKASGCDSRGEFGLFPGREVHREHLNATPVERGGGAGNHPYRPDLHLIGRCECGS